MNDSTPDASDAGLPGLPPHRKRHQRHLLACVGCRKIKTRCLGNEDQVSACQRCQRLNLDCVYERKRRRRTSGSPVLPSGSREERDYSTAEPSPQDRVVSRPRERPDVISESSVRFTTPSEASTSNPPQNSRPVSHAANKRIDIREYLDPELPRKVHGNQIDAEKLRRHAERVEGSMEDPILHRLIGVQEAENLVRLFMQHVNPMTGTLDPYLHTLDYLRGAAPILLSAVLTVAAKFFHPGLYRPLLAHLHESINLAVGIGQCDIGLVQALIITIVWKDPHDSSAWVKLGIAIRLGYQIGLHVPRRTPLSTRELDARKKANSERTWYTLSSFDRLYSDVFSLPPTIKLEELRDAAQWAEETAWLGCGDIRHACTFSSASTYRMWVKYRQHLPTMSKELAWAILSDLYGQIEEHMRVWFPPDPAMGSLTPFEQIYLKWFDINHLMKLKYQMLEICIANERDSAILDWFQLAEMFTFQTEALGLRGTLRYLQDTSATHISTFGVMVYNLFTRLPAFQKRVVTGFVKRLSKCCKTATLGEGETVMGFVARFMSRLELVLEGADHELRRPIVEHEGMVKPIPVPPVDNNGTLDLDDFFRTVIQNGQSDITDFETVHQFWFDPNIVLQ